ncbi:ankyrin repeat-containing domain protein, partial [Ilyonectria sp. MPI-CAGE-AT-0026]
IVQLLVENNVDVSAQRAKYGSALQVASVRGHENDEKIVQLLIDNNADVCAEGGDNGSAFQAALAGGNKKIIRLLLDINADVNAQNGGYYGTALQAAAAGRDEKIVRLLIDKNADVNAKGGCSGSALQAASAHGREKIVQYSSITMLTSIGKEDIMEALCRRRWYVVTRRSFSYSWRRMPTTIFAIIEDECYFQSSLKVILYVLSVLYTATELVSTYYRLKCL